MKALTLFLSFSFSMQLTAKSCLLDNLQRQLNSGALKRNAHAFVDVPIYLGTKAINPLNIHTVDGGKVYRSATMNGRQLTKIVERRKIKTVLNLRGMNPKKKWYQEEVKTLEALGVKLVDVSLSAKTYPTLEQLRIIRQTLREAPKPVLIHCKAGADRTGLVSALYAIEVLGMTPKQAVNRFLIPSKSHIEAFKPKMKEFILEVYEKGMWDQ